MPSNWRSPPRPGAKSPEQGRSYNRLNREIDRRREGGGWVRMSEMMPTFPRSHVALLGRTRAESPNSSCPRTRRLSNRELQFLGRPKRNFLACLDLDRFSGRRIAPHTSRTLPNLEDAETHNT